MDGMDCIREDEENDQRQMMDTEASDEGLERNVQEELAKMASSLMATAQSLQHGEEGEQEEEESLNDGEAGAGPVKPLVKRARKLLFRRLRVGVEDGRVFIGKFHCLDKQGNIILYDTMEFRQISPPSSSPSHGTSSLGTSNPSSSADEGAMEQRSLGLVLIPARCRTTCFVECSLHEQFSLLSV